MSQAPESSVSVWTQTLDLLESGDLSNGLGRLLALQPYMVPDQDKELYEDLLADVTDKMKDMAGHPEGGWPPAYCKGCNACYYPSQRWEHQGWEYYKRRMANVVRCFHCER